MKKKIIAIAAALSTASALLCGTVCAAINTSDIENLRDAIFGIATITSNDDVNSDGVIDSFDMCMFRKNSRSTGNFTEQNYAATESNVKLIGRTYRDDDTTWLVQSGSAVEFTLTGKTAEITLAGDDCISNGEDYRPRYAVFVNDELLVDSTMSKSEESITLFDSTASQTAKIKIIHLSEAMNGAIGVKNIKVNSDSISPISPTAKKDLCIEFIGDSITCAYGVEGLSNSESFKTTTENFMKSYAYLTAKKLDADYSAVCYSGHGVISGYTSSGDINTDSLIPTCYGLVGKLSDYAYDWDFSSSENDVVVINLGTNDSGYVTATDTESRSTEFIDGYVDFLKMIREKNSEAYIICTLGTMGCEDVYKLVEQAVSKYSDTTGDLRIMSYQSVTQNSADGYGSDWHPSAVTQQNSAYVLADKICQALGMDSDQIGLDVSADAEYVLNIDSDKGGNAASYVGYDKSFWINVVTGGATSDTIEAVIDGIGLRNGGEYRLEFDYTTSISSDIPVIIRSNSDSTKIYFNDTISGSAADKTHYSTEFTVSESDEDTSLVFQLGGQDYSNLTLSNVKLVKIA